MKKLNGWMIPKENRLHVPVYNSFDDQYYPARYWNRKQAEQRITEMQNGYLEYQIKIMKTNTFIKPYQLFALYTQAARDQRAEKQKITTEEITYEKKWLNYVGKHPEFRGNSDLKRTFIQHAKLGTKLTNFENMYALSREANHD